MESIKNLLKSAASTLATTAAPLGAGIAKEVGEEAANEIFDLVENTETELDDAALEHGLEPFLEGFQARIAERRAAAAEAA